MPTQNEIRETVTNTILQALSAGTAPWRRPWSSDSNAGAPTNAVSGKKYSGVNPLLLQIAADHFGFKGKYWGTYRQWSELGGQVKSRPSDVKAGEWGTGIVFCKPCKKTREENGQEIEDKFWITAHHLRSRYTGIQIQQRLDIPQGLLVGHRNSVTWESEQISLA